MGAGQLNSGPACLRLRSHPSRGALPAAGAWGTGVALDLAGGRQSAAGWMLVFTVLAVGIAMGPLALLWARAGETKNAMPAK